jgi:hypothetical protein
MLPIHRNLVTIKLRCFYNNLVCNEFSSWSVCTYPYMKYPFSISTRCFIGRLANALLTYELTKISPYNWFSYCLGSQCIQ